MDAGSESSSSSSRRLWPELQRPVRPATPQAPRQQPWQ
jgi:hypothetical protein